jgi:DNA polymerase-3 subunit epsilon
MLAGMAEIIREIAVDTETTGFDSNGGDRIVEIGGVELVNHTPTGRHFHSYVNPEGRAVGNSYEVHKLSDEFLADKPRFSEVADGFLEFIGDAVLVIHNAPFDVPFINMELARIGREPLSWSRVVDSLEMSRRINPQLGRHSLDALCKRYNIDNSERKDAHGALLDARLLAEVYIELLGGKEVDFFKRSAEEPAQNSAAGSFAGAQARAARPYHAPRSFPLSEAELAAHAKFVESLGPAALWKKPAIADGS